MNNVPNPRKPCSKKSLALIVIDNCAPSNSFSSWDCAILVNTMESARQALCTNCIDIVLSPDFFGSEVSIALPLLLLQLKYDGTIPVLPHLLWCGDLLHGLLDSHAQLARDAGLSVHVIPFLNFEMLKDISRLIPEYNSLNFKNTPVAGVDLDPRELLIALLGARDVRIVVQPQVDLLTGAYIGAEALLRWHHPKFGDIPPSLFAPLANKSGLSLLLFHFVESKVVSLLHRLKECDIALPISVNVSADTLCTPGFVQRLEHRLQLVGVPNELLKIELTEEGAISDMLTLSTVLSWLRIRGFSISMDDYGCGVSTLDLLTRLPFCEVKINHRFVQGMSHKVGFSAAVSSAISISQEMGLNCIAQGIETQEQVQALLAVGCHYGQGIALACPIEIDNFVAALCAT